MARRLFTAASATVASLLACGAFYLDLSFSAPSPVPAAFGQDVDRFIRGSAVVLCAVSVLLFWIVVPRGPRRLWILGVITAAVAGIGTWGVVAQRALSTNDLCWAAENGDLVTVERAVRQGVPLDGREVWGWYNSLGETALTKAAFNGQTEVVRCLLDHGASVGLSDGNEPLESAVARHHADIVRLLLAHHADPNAHLIYNGKPTGPTALCTAIQVDDLQIAKILLEAGARPDEPCLMPPRLVPGSAAKYAAWCGSSEMKSLVGGSLSTERTPDDR